MVSWGSGDYMIAHNTAAYNKAVGTARSSGSQAISKVLGVCTTGSTSGLTGSVTIPALAVGITNSLSLISKQLGNFYIRY